MLEVLNTLRDIEADAVQCSLSKGEPHIGSVKFLGTKGKKLAVKGPTQGSTRPGTRRIPSFGMGVHIGKTTQASSSPDYSIDELRPAGETGPLPRTPYMAAGSEDPSEDEEDEELEAILALNGVNIREEPPLPSTNADDREGSWGLNNWVQEHLNQVVPEASQSQHTAQRERSMWNYFS